MSTDPQFAATVAVGAALLGAVETDTLTPTQSSVILTAGTNGSKVEEIVVAAAKTGTLIATTVAGLVYVYLYDGSVYRLFDTIPVTAVTASTTVGPFRANRLYSNLVLPSGWSLRASNSIAGNVSILQVTALGGSF